MFDNLELPSSMIDYLISISPMLGLTGSVDDYSIFVFKRYLVLSDNQIVLPFSTSAVPKTISLNVLRKGEDQKIISAYTNEKLQENLIEPSKELKVPYYKHSVISFEAKLEKLLEHQGTDRLAIYEVVSSVGVAGLDPTFNDEITLSKTLEVMSLSAVDNYVIERKIKNIK